MDFRPIVVVIGALLAILALAMLVPAAVDAFHRNPDWEVFVLSAGVTLFVGVAMALTGGIGEVRLSIREAFLMTALSWVVLPLFATLPFVYSDLRLSFTDAYFEAMSGFTTTGSTVIVGLDKAPPGILMWRALTQWFGGIGIIVMGIAVLPMLKVGGMQLFRMESSDKSEKALPRAAQIAGAIGIIYLVISAVIAGAYWLAGMSGFEAIAHAMTTIATGGYSTSDNSIGKFNSVAVEVVGIVGMIAGSLPLVLYLRMIQGHVFALFGDSQVQWYLSIIVLTVLVTASWVWLKEGIEPATALRQAAFNVVSVITTTGYATTDYGLWGSFAVPVFFFITFVGGCAGSTAGGIKIFRLQVLYAAARAQIHHLLQPHGVFIPYYNRRPITDEIIFSVLSFFFMWFFTFAVISLGLALVGLDFLTAVSSAATAMANVGPALGPIAGPAGTFQPFPDAAKWFMSGGMVLGRLELFTMMVLLSRSFWRG